MLGSVAGECSERRRSVRGAFPPLAVSYDKECLPGKGLCARDVNDHSSLADQARMQREHRREIA